VTHNNLSVESVGGGKLDQPAIKPSNMAGNPPQSSSSRRPRIGDTTVGQFRIEDEIGKGSFATVYRGVAKVRRVDSKLTIASKGACIRFSRLYVKAV
jgi:hypothetical protein